MSNTQETKGQGQHLGFSKNHGTHDNRTYGRGRGRSPGHRWGPRAGRSAPNNVRKRPYLGANTLSLTPTEPGFEFFKLSFLEDPWLELTNEQSLTTNNQSAVLRPTSDFPATTCHSVDNASVQL